MKIKIISLVFDSHHIHSIIPKILYFILLNLSRAKSIVLVDFCFFFLKNLYFKNKIKNKKYVFK